ncbi:hypothetical protein GCM10011518_34270 [Flavobacterium limi]|uniref:Uncharacterized protein n=1 Tax=Flavobacterium limi TaxID=2045105 RepID=A0ABQ1UN88_9FLAO|nr:hypothetical protein GCM10011518_34270 [Flavobacterium limi]
MRKKNITDSLLPSVVKTKTDVATVSKAKITASAILLNFQFVFCFFVYNHERTNGVKSIAPKTLDIRRLLQIIVKLFMFM